MRSRDNQKSKVYAWERRCVRELAHSSLYDPEFSKLEECIEFAEPIWRKERGRVGLAKHAAPTIERPHRGQRSALAYADHRITLPRWARSRWVILHELCHRLTPRDEAHGPRFVGVLMGLVCRHMDYDATQLMALAEEMGVNYYVRSIGSVPIRGPVWHVLRTISREGPMTAMDLACHLSLAEGLDVTVKNVRGAALYLIKTGRARWYRNELTLIDRDEPSATPAELELDMLYREHDGE